MNNKSILIAVGVGLPFIAVAYFTVVTYRRLDPHCVSWQRTCTKWLTACLALVALFMATVAFVRFPYSMLSLIPLALYLIARTRFTRVAGRHAQLLCNPSDGRCFDAGRKIG